MNTILFVLATTIVVIYGKPLDSAKDAKILKYENEIGPNGMYRFFYETSDGTRREESGSLETKNNEEILVVNGFYSYLDEKGKVYDVYYVADDLGYRVLKKMMVEPTAPTRYGAPAMGYAGEGLGTISTRIDPTVLGTLIGGGV